jgi:hypothetical protein
MVVLHGVYHFKPKTVAYRNDFCVSCSRLRRAYQIRTFDFIHFFYIPLIPLGFWRRWQCDSCGSDPHTYPEMRKGAKWAGVAALAMFTAVAWLEPAGDDKYRWGLRVGMLVVFVWAAWVAARNAPSGRLKVKLREVRPADESVCPLCSIPLVVNSVWHCPHCNIERKTVRVH